MRLFHDLRKSRIVKYRKDYKKDKWEPGNLKKRYYVNFEKGYLFIKRAKFRVQVNIMIKYIFIS